jgi:hypothetical protein
VHISLKRKNTQPGSTEFFDQGKGSEVEEFSVTRWQILIGFKNDD